MLKRTTIITLDILTIEDGSHLFCKAKINGKNSRILIDTGASRTVFDQTRISLFVNEKSVIQNEKLSTGLGTNSMPTSILTLKSFKIGDLKIENFEAVLLDLQHVNITYGTLGHEPIDGVLGNDILVDYKAVIDYDKKILRLKTK
jgi:predicted aspartyl protease